MAKDAAPVANSRERLGLREYGSVLACFSSYAHPEVVHRPAVPESDCARQPARDNCGHCHPFAPTRPVLRGLAPGWLVGPPAGYQRAWVAVERPDGQCWMAGLARPSWIPGALCPVLSEWPTIRPLLGNLNTTASGGIWPIAGAMGISRCAYPLAHRGAWAQRQRYGKPPIPSVFDADQDLAA